MDVRKLTYFMAVAEELHFGRAAERLDMAQPPLSRQIRQLEEELGAPLFHRGRNGISLTQAGQCLFQRGSAILDSIADSEREVRRIGQGLEGRLRLGYVGSSVYGILPTIVKSFRAHYPGLFLSLAPMNNAALQRALIRREIDLAIARPALADPEIISRPLSDEPLSLAAPDSLFPNKAAVEPRDVSGQTLILYPEYPRPSFADVVLEACRTHGIDVSRRVFTMDVSTALGLAAVGEGVVVVPASVGSGTRNGVRFHRFATSIGRTGLSINHRIDDQSVHVSNFTRIARAVGRKAL